MSKNGKIALVTIIGILVVLASWFFMGIHYRNAEATVRNKHIAQQDVVELVHDKTWKVLQQKAGVTNQYKEAFEKIYPELMAGRYDKGGSFMKWIQESNPNFDVSLYKDLMTAIEALRAELVREQKVLLDLERDHHNLYDTEPSSWFVKETETRKKVQSKIISSTKSKAAIETGIDDDVELFNK